jgi:hypothetical protein
MAYGLINADTMADSSGGVMSPISSVMRNRIINGSMTIDQRAAGASTTITSSGYYSCDRWNLFASASSKYSVQQNAGSVTPPVGFQKYLGFTSLSSYSVSSGDYFFFQQVIEANNMQDLAWGTANAKAVTLSFQVYSSVTGTFSGSIENYAGNRSYPFTYTVSSANTWTSISITIAGDTSGTWTASGNSGWGSVNFDLGSGSTIRGTANAWAAGNYIGATGAASIIGTNGATFYITGVQLEKGSSATGFEYRQYGQELALCQRYYEVSNFNYTWSGNSTNGSNYLLNTLFRTSKRASPSISYTITGYSGFPATNPNVTGTPGIDGAIAYCTSNNTQSSAYFQYSWTASAEL